jgi:hypothetical protein
MAAAGGDDMHRHTLIEQHGFMATAQVVKPRTGEAKGLRPNSWVTLRGFCRLVNERSAPDAVRFRAAPAAAGGPGAHPGRRLYHFSGWPRSSISIAVALY